MKAFVKLKSRVVVLFVFSLMFNSFSLLAQNENYKEFEGKVVDVNTNKPLIFATVEVKSTNISTVTNSEGTFLIKVPQQSDAKEIMVSFLGYKTKVVLISDLSDKKNTIKLNASTVELAEVTVPSFKDASVLVRKMLQSRGANNNKESILMTAFYRETIKKRKRNVSLAEAIVNISKQSNTSLKKDIVELYKIRKKTDYKRLDTISLKLKGGPYNPLYLDVMKYPDFMFSNDNIGDYNFTFAPSTSVDGKNMFVVNFSQKQGITDPLFYGKLFIDSQTYALKSAIYNLNVTNQQGVRDMFVSKKPRNVEVTPTYAAYRVDYRTVNDKWYYNYGNVQLDFRIKKKGRLFNSNYSLVSEMAVTDLKVNTANEKLKNRLKPSVVIADETSGFSDPEFWGAYNVIEPEKSIESAIKKIKRKLKKENSN